MNSYLVLYRIESIMSPSDEPFQFRCFADDGDHAEEQCLDAYPDADVVWVTDRVSIEDALADYWATQE